MQGAVERVARALEDRYRVERQIGVGGMAIVYLAQDLRYDRSVAVKVLKPDIASAVGTDRFLREIRITAQLNHPHILPLLDSGDHQRHAANIENLCLLGRSLAGRPGDCPPPALF